MEGFEVRDHGGVVIAVALHAGHALRPSLQELCALDADVRKREEDPHTEVLADLGTSMMVARRSRFEVDLNRPREAAVYMRPEDAWGLEVWTRPLDADERAESLRLYDEFYEAAECLLARAVARFGYAVVLDIHSYNHRRSGPEAPPALPEGNPEVNIGTGTLDTDRWGGLVSAFGECLSSHGLDVRENVRFRGGHFAAWAHDRFGGSVAVLALEFKKTFMDEWTGQVDAYRLECLRDILASCAEAVVPSIGGRR